MTRRRLMWVVGAVVAALLLWGFERSSGTWWVGHTDLEIVFILTDGGSNEPIPAARVEIESAGGFYKDAREESFVLIADASGVASKECPDSMCFGTDSLLGYTRSYVVHLPWWRYRAIAAGFEPSEWTDLDIPEIRKQVQRVEPGKAKLVVRVPLQKRSDKKNAE